MVLQKNKCLGNNRFAEIIREYAQIYCFISLVSKLFYSLARKARSCLKIIQQFIVNSSIIIVYYYVKHCIAVFNGCNKINIMQFFFVVGNCNSTNFNFCSLFFTIYANG